MFKKNQVVCLQQVIKSDFSSHYSANLLPIFKSYVQIFMLLYEDLKNVKKPVMKINKVVFNVQLGLQVPAARIFEELPCFGVKFSNIHPVSESGFLPGIFWRGIYCHANFFCYTNFFLLFSNQFFGRGKFPEQIA